jgi:hypothetical protein
MYRELVVNCKPELKKAIVGSHCLKELIDHLETQDEYGDYGLTPDNVINIRVSCENIAI